MSLWVGDHGGSDAKKKVDEKCQIAQNGNCRQSQGREFIASKNLQTRSSSASSRLMILTATIVLVCVSRLNRARAGGMAQGLKTREIMETSVDDESDRNGARVFSCQIKQNGKFQRRIQQTHALNTSPKLPRPIRFSSWYRAAPVAGAVPAPSSGAPARADMRLMVCVR
jgi:hypothetical protein